MSDVMTVPLCYGRVRIMFGLVGAVRKDTRDLQEASQSRMGDY